MTAAVRSIPAAERVEFRYHLLRAAGERFQSGVADLDDRQLAEATRQAHRTIALEDLVLGSAEALDLVVPAERVEAAVGEVRARYADPTEFGADLARNGLDADTLHRALRRELAFDGVMQRVAGRAPAVDELAERLFFDAHRERFQVPERRTARHLLITVNDDYAENRRDRARARIEDLAARLQGPAGGRIQRFDDLARRHSECPTAVEGGRLGEVEPGRLYPALDALLFGLSAGGIGGPVESDLGFHLILCERIQPARSIPFDQARPQIRELLESRARRQCQQDWIADLRRAAGSAADERQ
jgi:peptidyl-prolyl cis-trans isomerase C